MIKRILYAVAVGIAWIIAPASAQPTEIDGEFLVQAARAVVTHHGFERPAMAEFTSSALQRAPADTRRTYRDVVSSATGIPAIEAGRGIRCEEPTDHRTCSMHVHDALIDILDVQQVGATGSAVVAIRYGTPEIDRQPITHRVWKVLLKRTDQGWVATDLRLAATS